MTIAELHRAAAERVDSMANIDLYDRDAYARREGLRIARDVVGDLIAGRVEQDNPMVTQAFACLETHGLRL